MGYYILQSTAPAPTQSAQAPDLDRWLDALENGSPIQRREALRQLVSAGAEDRLTQCLRSANVSVVELAVSGLWECWLNEAGAQARREIDAGTESMNTGDLEEAAGTFSRLMARHPDWAEAVNKLATVRYLQNQPEASIQLCLRAVALKPDHFGVWNGLALCSIQIEDWPQALRAVRESLRLQPHSPINRQLLSLVESRVPSV